MRLSAELPEAPPGDGGDAPEIQWLSRRRYGKFGDYHADYIRDLLGNLEMMMRILINSAGALCAYTSLGGDPKAMARLYCVALVRELSGPSHPPRL